MTIPEINKAIAELLGLSVRKSQSREGVSINITNTFGYHDVGFVDYCNNWEDLMPEVDFNYEMKSLDSGRFHCSVMRDFNIGDPDICTSKSVETKQLALAECFLKVLQEKAKENDK